MVGGVNSFVKLVLEVLRVQSFIAMGRLTGPKLRVSMHRSVLTLQFFM
jgi:hypothetical protein